MGKSYKQRKHDQKRELKEKHIDWGLKPGEQEGSSFSKVSKLIEIVNINPEAYKALAEMKEKVDEKVYKNVLMNPEFIKRFIKVYRYNKDSREAAQKILKYTETFKRVEDKKMLDVSSDLKGKLSRLFKELPKRYQESD